MKPWLTDHEIELFEGILRKLAKSRKHLEILEWGMGGSTVYFPRFLIKNKIDFTWTSIEHDSEWFAKIKDAVEINTHLVLVPLIGDDPHAEPMDDYVDHPTESTKKYDLIFIDGRKRLRCLAMAAKYIKPDGVVVLDDAFREKYHDNFKYYNWKYLEDSNKLWIGKIKAKKQ